MERPNTKLKNKVKHNANNRTRDVLLTLKVTVKLFGIEKNQ